MELQEFVKLLEKHGRPLSDDARPEFVFWPGYLSMSLRHDGQHMHVPLKVDLSDPQVLRGLDQSLGTARKVLAARMNLKG